MIEKTKKLNVPGQKQTKQVKVALVGDSQTGKSAFMKQYISNQFAQNYAPTLGVETGDKYIDKNGFVTHVTIWDFNGKLDFADLRNQFYREADVVLVFCDLSNKNTIDSIDFWVREAKDNSANTVMVVGNKSDCKKVSMLRKQPSRHPAHIFKQVPRLEME